MTKLGPDQRPGYKKIGLIEGYNRWTPTYDKGLNPLIFLEERVTLGLMDKVRDQHVLDCSTGRYCALLAERGAKVWV
jgi:hypothetical protein